MVGIGGGLYFWLLIALVIVLVVLVVLVFLLIARRYGWELNGVVISPMRIFELTFGKQDDRNGQSDRPTESTPSPDPSAVNRQPDTWTRDLSVHLNGVVSGRRWNSRFDQLVRDEVNHLIAYLDGYPQLNIPVRTSVLYEAVKDCIVQCNRITIVDQDILRWSELVNEHERIDGNTFNYSKEILDRSIAAADNRGGYRLQRIFVVDSNLLRGENRARILRILTAVEQRCARYPRRIKNRVFQVDVGQATQSLMRDYLQDYIKDAVLINDENDPLLLQEEITWERRESTLKTTSRISGDSMEINRIKGMTEELFDSADSIPEFLASLASEERQ